MAGEEDRVLVVLDDRARGEVPPEWRKVAPAHSVVHCPPGQAATLLGELAGDGRPRVDVLAGGPLVAEALRLAESHWGAVRSVLLLGPDPAGDGQDSRQWFSAHGTSIAKARDLGVEIELLPHGPARAALSEPRVAVAVARALDSLPAVRRPEE